MTAQSAAVRQPLSKPEFVKNSSEDVFNQYSQVQDLIARRAFELFANRGRAPGYELADWFRAESELLHQVPLNILESDDTFIVEAEVPGFRGEDIRITVERRRIVISGKRKVTEQTESTQMIRFECRADRILRTIELSADVDTDQVSSTMKDGILAVELRKLRDPK